MNTYGSVCSGIEAASVAWSKLWWKPVWFSEVDPFPCAVLAHHYPRIPNLGDMRKIKELVLRGAAEAPDIIVGGTPCQAFSVAGARNSLDDERGQLTLEYVRLLNAIDLVRRKNNLPESICVWENVPGVLNTKDNAFGCFLAALVGEGCEIQPAGGRWTNAGCVFGPQRTVVWRTLDAQYFGLAQRRKRVFVIASARKDINPTEILFEFDSLRRDIAPSRKEGQDSTADARTSFTPTSFCQYKSAIGTLRASGGDLGGGSEVLRNNGQENAILSFRACGQDGFKPSDVVPTLLASDGGGVVPSIYDSSYGIPGNYNSRMGSSVRRLTPIECERLQGFPDNYSKIPWRGAEAKDCPDSHRYKALGNSMAVPVMAWIGERIDKHLKEIAEYKKTTK